MNNELSAIFTSESPFNEEAPLPPLLPLFTHDSVPLPLVFNTWPLDPSDVGNVKLVPLFKIATVNTPVILQFLLHVTYEQDWFFQYQNYHYLTLSSYQ